MKILKLITAPSKININCMGISVLPTIEEKISEFGDVNINYLKLNWLKINKAWWSVDIEWAIIYEIRIPDRNERWKCSWKNPEILDEIFQIGLKISNWSKNLSKL